MLSPLTFHVPFDWGRFKSSIKRSKEEWKTKRYSHHNYYQITSTIVCGQHTHFWSCSQEEWSSNAPNNNKDNNNK